MVAHVCIDTSKLYIHLHTRLIDTHYNILTSSVIGKHVSYGSDWPAAPVASRDNQCTCATCTHSKSEHWHFNRVNIAAQTLLLIVVHYNYAKRVIYITWILLCCRHTNTSYSAWSSFNMLEYIVYKVLSIIIFNLLLFQKNNSLVVITAIVYFIKTSNNYIS